MQPQSSDCIPLPAVGLPSPVTMRTASMTPTIVSIGITMFFMRGVTLRFTAVTASSSSTAERGSSSSPVVSARSSALFIGPKSSGRKVESMENTIAIMQ